MKLRSWFEGALHGRAGSYYIGGGASCVEEGEEGERCGGGTFFFPFPRLCGGRLGWGFFSARCGRPSAAEGKTPHLYLPPADGGKREERGTGEEVRWGKVRMGRFGMARAVEEEEGLRRSSISGPLYRVRAVRGLTAR